MEQSSLLDWFVSYEENGVLWIQYQSSLLSTLSKVLNYTSMWIPKWPNPTYAILTEIYQSNYVTSRNITIIVIKILQYHNYSETLHGQLNIWTDCWLCETDL
jgi:hypothetical protein